MHTFPYNEQEICCFYIVSHLCTLVNRKNTFSRMQFVQIISDFPALQ